MISMILLKDIIDKSIKDIFILIYMGLQRILPIFIKNFR